MISSNFLSLDLSPEELTKRNTSLKKDREAGHDSQAFRDTLLPMLRSESGIRAVIVCFADLEGKLHLLDYNKEFFMDSMENLTFDGSSINGFTSLNQSDLRLFPDWTSFRWLPASVFGAGKVMIFGRIAKQDGTEFENDMRSKLGTLLEELRNKKNQRVLVAPEIEGFLLDDIDAEQKFTEESPFELATKTGYFSALPQDKLRQFIDAFAKILGELGFENEKDHPEVAPSQFELNWKYTDALHTADQILIYKLVARQVAKSMGMTASFLPKPFAKINGSGMHANMSIAENGKNIFYDGSDADKLSEIGRQFAAGILNRGKELCLIMNPSVNAYRRLDPKYEAPNEIKMSDKDRGSMVRIPVGNEKSARIEVRTVAPDANPYLTFYTFIKSGQEGIDEKMSVPTGQAEILPENIHLSLTHYEGSEFLQEIMGEDAHQKYGELKVSVANRAAREHGHFVKTGEVLFHHEVTNQYLWDQF
ncbi:MAG: glutamine synthetase family protein [Candidatus Gracilibacteria bacterium]|nr:glutamine synthetase family protein [Candidatus Gracilibacteria bacterium]